MHKLQSDNHAIFINPDRTPAGGHIRRFNAPVVDDVAGIMVGDHTATRQIVIRRRNNSLQSIPDTHRLYDALQYPLIFWKGQDGYCINLKQRDPVTGQAFCRCRRVWFGGRRAQELCVSSSVVVTTRLRPNSLR
ncbi:uncharacterized protein LOC124461689 isoform X3 [Drosophila willistoni]|uniref:uncharacterized protein LOC124461689 isoform X3 n=1 Tax=Drosophila willistoni TaxID=7260 RepID=UPI001F073DFE|nr:uncharacterized protein LOC124461689 isoform X3 [Drosophila willistoni]